MLDYPIELTPDNNDTFLVTCPDLPEVTTFGETEEEARRSARGAIEEALAGRLDGFQDIPRPSKGDLMVPISSLIGLKVLLLWELQNVSMTRADLVRKLGWKRTQVDRLFAPRHSTRLDQFDAAFEALGKHIEARAA